MNSSTARSPSKVPEATLVFWIIKIAATTLGETGGDALSMTLHLGYVVSTAIFFAIFLAVVTAQIRAKTFHPLLYWAVIVATTTTGTTIADFADRSLGIGYVGGSLSLFVILMLVLGTWRFALGAVSVDDIATPAVERFYWTTILFSNTLGTALGDLASSDTGLGFEGGSLVFAVALAVIALAYVKTRWSRALLFWSAFILTRPLGATLGDLLTKPRAAGGLDVSRIVSSSFIAVFIIICILVLPQRAGGHPGQRAPSS
jgi:uncharacterized membrane-anchored protein